MGARMAVKGAASRQPGIKGVSGDPASRKNGEQRLGECRDAGRKQGSGTVVTLPETYKERNHGARRQCGETLQGGQGAPNGSGGPGRRAGTEARNEIVNPGRGGRAAVGPSSLHSGLGAAGAGRGGGAGRWQEDKMAAADGSFSPGPPPPPPPRAGKGVSARLAQTHLAGCAGVRNPGSEAPRRGWRRGGGGWRRMAPRSAPPVSLAHSAAGLRLTAHPGNRRPREHPPPASRLPPRLNTPPYLHRGRAPVSPTPPRRRAVPLL